MTIEEIQKRVDALAAAMLAKGKAEPASYVRIESDCGPTLVAKWSKKPGEWSNEYEHFSADTLSGQFEKAMAWVAALPTPEQVRINAFMSSLSETIELGKKADIDGEYVNPLLALMQTLSKNALTHSVS